MGRRCIFGALASAFASSAGLASALLSAAFLSVTPAGAQDLGLNTGTIIGRPTILTLDQERLYAESLFGKALEAKSAEAVAQLSTENRKIEADLTAEEKALTEKRKTMSAADFKPLAAAFDAKVEKIRAEQDAKSKAIQKDRDAGRKKFFETALPILAELMREKGALAILDKSSVILAFDSIDVTGAAIAALDARLGDGSNLPADGSGPDTGSTGSFTPTPPPAAPTPAPAPPLTPAPTPAPDIPPTTPPSGSATPPSP